jgi:hypothetical protein
MYCSQLNQCLHDGWLSGILLWKKFTRCWRATAKIADFVVRLWRYAESTRPRIVDEWQNCFTAEMNRLKLVMGTSSMHTVISLLQFQNDNTFCNLPENNELMTTKKSCFSTLDRIISHLFNKKRTFQHLNQPECENIHLKKFSRIIDILGAYNFFEKL